MSYDLLVIKGYDEEHESFDEIPKELVLSALEEHAKVRKDEYGLWEYDDEGLGFGISFDDESSSCDHVSVTFSYSCPEPEATYRLAVEFSLWLADKLGGKVYDPQLDDYLSSENIDEGVRNCLELFRRFEEHAMRRVRAGEHVFIGPRRAVLRSMYRRGAESRKKAGFKIWHVVLIVAIAMALMLLVRLIRTGTL